jgi:Protein of unknown function (DUF4019)
VTYAYPVLIAILVLVGFPARAAESDAVPKAQVSAKAWLALTDGGKYAESWNGASTLFKTAITKADWEKAIRATRAPLGALKSRTLKSATFARTLPGAPDGEYVVIQYETAFENKASAVETVTPMLDKDGSWRISGYYIK